MGNLYLNKFRIDSARAPWWNYRDAAAYFITICTYRRIHFFGNISNDKLVPSPIGRIVEDEWLKSFQIREDMNLKSGKYVVMPNHFHAIITIGQNRFNSQNCNFQNALLHF